MNEKLELAIEVLDELAGSRPGEFYHQMVFNLTADAQHAAMYMNTADLKVLANFSADVRILKKWDKEEK